MKEHSLEMSGTQNQNIAHCHVWVELEQRMLLRSLSEGRGSVTAGMWKAGLAPGSGACYPGE